MLSMGTLLPSTRQVNAGHHAKWSTAIVRQLFRQQLASQVVKVSTFSSRNLPAREGQRVVAGAILEDGEAGSGPILFWRCRYGCVSRILLGKRD